MEQTEAGVAATVHGRRLECSVCGRDMEEPVPVYEARAVPTSSCSPVDSRETALRVRRGDISLVCCRSCGFIFNQRFDSRLLEYGEAYEDRQTFSQTFNAFQTDLVRYLVEKYDLRGKSIVEIGSGRGDFLRELCAAGGNRGVGIDPRCSEKGDERVAFVKELLGPTHADLPAHFFCCRHTLEHVQDPVAFLTTLRTVIGHRLETSVFFEVPDTLTLLTHNAFWDVQYEHCSYFAAESIRQLFESSGFEVTSTGLVYGAQYLIVEARPALHIRHATTPPARVLLAAERFGREVAEAIESWNGLISQQRGRKVVIWGAGAKCQGFTSAVASASRNVQHVVDVNPNLHGRFMVGVGLEIKAPAFLAEFGPDLVIVMNAVYKREITSALLDLGVRCEIRAL